MNEQEVEGPGVRGKAPAKNFDRAPSDPAVVALRMEDLTVWAIERAAKMPRDHKFTVGDKLVEGCLQVTTLLTEASYVRDKLALLAEASRALSGHGAFGTTLLARRFVEQQRSHQRARAQPQQELADES